MRKIRYVKDGKHHLTEHEINELYEDFDIEVAGYYALVPLTRKEWNYVKNFNKVVPMILADEKVLGRDWLDPLEDEAWKDL